MARNMCFSGMKSIQVLCHLLPSASVRYCVQSKGQNAFSCCLQFHVPLRILEILSYFFLLLLLANWEHAQFVSHKTILRFGFLAFEGAQKSSSFLLKTKCCTYLRNIRTLLTHKRQPIQFRIFSKKFMIVFIYHWSTEKKNHNQFTLQLE